MKNKIIIQNQMGELEKVNAFLEEHIGNSGSLAALLTTINLVMEEALSNIINYAYDDDLTHQIELELETTSRMVRIEITDDGKEFDPTKKSDPDITQSAAERPIGGLGIFLIRQMMDGVHYARRNNKNIFTMTKKI